MAPGETVRCKFYCMKVEKTSYGTEEVSFTAVTPANSQATPENEQFWRATPRGTLHLGIDNPAAQGRFEEGKYYNLDFSLAES